MHGDSRLLAIFDCTALYATVRAATNKVEVHTISREDVPLAALLYLDVSHVHNSSVGEDSMQAEMVRRVVARDVHGTL